jgi:hypothetical protein
LLDFAVVMNVLLLLYHKTNLNHPLVTINQYFLEELQVVDREYAVEVQMDRMEVVQLLEHC